MDPPTLDPHLVLQAYTQGAFPMARGRRPGSPVHWFTADPRAVLPLDPPPGGFKVRRSLARIVERNDLAVTRDRAFAKVVAACAQPRKKERDSWINPDIQRVYVELFEMGYAHSVEAWADRGDGVQLVGGLYGVAIGAAFFGESMFSKAPYASQVALVHLVEHLREHHFELLDVQFVNPHLEQFGVTEISAADYMNRLTPAVNQPPRW